jgi:hypothetical protein
MKLYVVLDTKGEGRLVGIWDVKRQAEKLTKRYPAYYKLHTININQINPKALSWTDNDEQRRFLEQMISKE